MEDGGMKTLEGGHKNEERGTGRASDAGLAMLEKDMPEWRQVKARTKCASYELPVPSVQSQGYLPTRADFAAQTSRGLQT